MRLISGIVQHYPWGSKHAIPALLGAEQTGDPWAEYWLGTHPLGAATLPDDPEHTLSDVISSDPNCIGKAAVDQFGPQLPYLLKVLSADAPLSLQAHPSRAQAEAGFAREQAAGVPFNAPERTFKDTWPKPELVVALTPFDALAGFRDPKKSAELFAQLPVHSSLESIIGPLTERSGSAALAEVFLDLLGLDRERLHLVEEVVAAAVPLMSDEGELGLFARTAVELDEHFPGDPGILAALLMNRLQLQPGQALFMPAGHMHAYLRGTAIEVMANSDNVLRGGLTKKHIDVDGLISVVEFVQSDIDIIEPNGDDGIYRYETPAPEFALWMIRPIDTKPVAVPATNVGRIALVTKGDLVLQSGDENLALTKGQAAFLPAGDDATIAGQGQVFLAAAGV